MIAGELRLSSRKEYMTMSATGKTKKEFLIGKLEEYICLAKDESISLKLSSDKTYVTATFSNGASYRICIECDSYMAMAQDIINFLAYK